MKIAGILQPGTVLNYVLEAKYVKAGLIVVQTIEERDKVLDENKNSLTNGTPIYVAETHKTYRYNEEQNTFTPDLSFKEDENGVLCTEGEDGSLKKIKVEVGVNNLDPKLKGEIENLPNTYLGLHAAADKVTNDLIIGSKTFNGSAAVTVSASDLGALTAVPQAMTETFGGVKLGHTEGANEHAVVLDDKGRAYVTIPPAITYNAGAGLTLNNNTFAIGNESVTAAMLAGGITDDKLVSLDVQKLTQKAGDLLILNGGAAE
jgi:hypothetical protein